MDERQYPIGIFSWFGYVMPLPKRLELIKNAGFDATTLWWEDEIGYPQINKNDMPKMVRESGLALENIHIPYDDCNSLWDDNNSNRRKIIDRYLTYLEDCAEYKIPAMVMHIIDGIHLPAPNSKGIGCIETLIKRAEEYKIKIAIENTQREDYIDYMFSNMQSINLGMCYDSSHGHLTGRGSMGILKKWGHLLIATHLSDNDGKKDRHSIPFDGEIDWRELSRYFPASTYSGFLTMELYNEMEYGFLEPAAFLEKAVTRINKLRNIITSIG